MYIYICIHTYRNTLFYPYCIPEILTYVIMQHGSREVWGVGLRPLACWNCGLESNWQQRCLLMLCCVAVKNLWGWPIPSPAESYRVSMWHSVIRCNNKPLHLQWINIKGHTKEIYTECVHECAPPQDNHLILEICRGRTHSFIQWTHTLMLCLLNRMLLRKT